MGKDGMKKMKTATPSLPGYLPTATSTPSEFPQPHSESSAWKLTTLENCGKCSFFFAISNLKPFWFYLYLDCCPPSLKVNCQIH